MELNAIQDSFERVAKKQKLSYSKSQELICQVGHEIEQALASIQSDNDSGMSIDPKAVLTELKAKLQIFGSHNHLEGPQRDLNMSLSKHQKLLEKMLYPDISNTYRNVDFDPHIVNQIIIGHFHREGLFDIADSLIQEASEPEAISLRLQFQEIHQILKALKSRNLEPALNWVSTNQERLKESGSNLELKLHKLHFVDILQNRSRSDALKYARIYLAPLASYHMKEIQKLMGSLLWAGKLDKSPYANLVDPIHWEKLAEELMLTYCNFAGQSFRDPLNVAVAAGAEGLPTLLKLANVMAAKKQEWRAMKQLPVPVELGKEFQFHSVFVCPVSREQGSEENPPMLLPCGHVLCKQSINKLSKGNSRSFKCPYCPQDASVAQCQQLYF
ncbi:UNVERIFIED_CONTAM: protein RMD5 [Sesamum latifolium]|uniref:Protein RMD5 n=1 Tax=Sesamum latifolium TaxID=2727402 RepID=A0AAW2V020_9LAMI